MAALACNTYRYIYHLEWQWTRDPTVHQSRSLQRPGEVQSILHLAVTVRSVDCFSDVFITSKTFQFWDNSNFQHCLSCGVEVMCRERKGKLTLHTRNGQIRRKLKVISFRKRFRGAKPASSTWRDTWTTHLKWRWAKGKHIIDYYGKLVVSLWAYLPDRA